MLYEVITLAVPTMQQGIQFFSLTSTLPAPEATGVPAVADRTGDEKESIRTIHRALEMGMNFLDTADIYGAGRNELLVGKAIRDRSVITSYSIHYTKLYDSGTGGSVS